MKGKRFIAVLVTLVFCATDGASAGPVAAGDNKVGSQNEITIEYGQPIEFSYQIADDGGPCWVGLRTGDGNYADLDWVALNYGPLSMINRLRSKGAVTGPVRASGTIKWPSADELGFFPGKYQFMLWRQGQNVPTAKSAAVTIAPPEVRYGHSIMVNLIRRGKIFSRCINDRRKKVTTYSKFPPYSQIAFKNGSSQEFESSRSSRAADVSAAA